MSDNPATTTNQTPDVTGVSGEATAAVAHDAGASDQISKNFDISSMPDAVSPPASTPAPRGERRGRVKSRSPRPSGSGAMGPRMPDDLPAPQREALDRAASDARATGHRFDLMRYLRLRRARTMT